MSWFYALVRSKIINRNFTFMIRLGLCSQKPYEKYRLGCRRVRTQSCWDIYPAARYHQLALPVACGSRSNLPRIGQSALVSSTKNWPISDRISLLLRRMTSWPFERQSALVLLPKNYFTSVFFDLRVTLEIYENLHTFHLITSLHFTSYQHFRGKSVLSSYFQYK